MELALSAKRSGIDVFVIGPNGPDRKTLEDVGIKTEVIKFTRRGWNPIVEIVSLLQLIFMLGKLKPTVVHAIAFKAVVYTVISSPFFNAQRIIGSITGFGSVFVSRKVWAAILRFFTTLILRPALCSKRKFLIFQNEDDQENFIANGLISRDRCVLIRGAGVDLQKYRMHSLSQLNVVRIVFPGRILRDKGVYELVQASRLLKSSGSPPFEIYLVGSVDLGNPSGFTESEIRMWEKEGTIKWLGHQNDMAKIFRECDIVCLPSYREGLPLALIEAAASGRAIVTTDVPGCRDVVENGKVGLVVAVRDSVALAAALKTLMLDSDLRYQLGTKARHRAEKFYGKEEIIALTLQLYGAQKNVLKKIV